MATRTTTTRTTSFGPAPSADQVAQQGLFFQTAPAPEDLFERLVAAYIGCRRNKRTSGSALAFELRREQALRELHDELASGAWRPGRSICFVVTRPKPREVWAADFRDRIVHHLLYNHIAPRFEAAFVADSCACIAGRGTLYAAQRLEHQVRSVTDNWRRPAWYLKCDLANFFVSIDKHVLRHLLQARIDPVRETWWAELADTVLMHDPRADVDVRCPQAKLRLVPPHKSLFSAPADTGLPIGNLSSQFFANVLLNPLDQRIKHRLRAPHYLRYVDDFVMLHESREWLRGALADIEAWLPAELYLQLNPRKTVLQLVDRGIDFVGHLIKPWCRRTRPRTVKAAVARVLSLPRDQVGVAANSYFGLLGQASHSHRDRARLANAVRRRGKAVVATLRKTTP
jgi:retron-type reverse transcriptase